MAPRVTETQREEAIRLHREGKSRREVARQIGRAASTVQRLLDDANVSEKSKREEQVEALMFELAGIQALLRSNEITACDKARLAGAMVTIREGIIKLAGC